MQRCVGAKVCRCSGVQVLRCAGPCPEVLNCPGQELGRVLGGAFRQEDFLARGFSEQAQHTLPFLLGMEQGQGKWKSKEQEQAGVNKDDYLKEPAA